MSSNEFEDVRECQAENVRVFTVSEEAVREMEATLRYDAPVRDRRRVLAKVLGATQTGVLEVCGFTGEVSVYSTRLDRDTWRETWECPVCRTQHDDEVDET